MMGRAVRFLKYAVAAPIINTTVAFFPSISKRKEPPNVINFSGGGDFIRIGDINVDSLVAFSALKSGARLFEIGSGIGRNATALHRRYGDAISYRGFDVVKYGITWCEKHFLWNQSSYEFVHADIFNSFYNPRGKFAATQYRFPSGDEEFDIVFAMSVFTHMQTADVEHYFAESGRVLRPGGMLLFSCFAIDEHSEGAIRSGVASLTFAHEGKDCRLESMTEPDRAVAYNVGWIADRLTASNLRLKAVERGNWRGIAASQYQDVVVAHLERPGISDNTDA